MEILKYEFFLPEKIHPKGFVYPQSYVEYVKEEKPYKVEFRPWHFLCNELEYRFGGLKKRYPTRTLIPFARRQDNDDVACFDGSEASADPRVLIIHDFAAPGWENRGELKNFIDWLRLAEEESKEWKAFMKNESGREP